jgi:hypothetical protein
VVLDWGLPQALWHEAERAQVVQHVDQLCPKRSCKNKFGKAGALRTYSGCV